MASAQLCKGFPSGWSREAGGNEGSKAVTTIMRRRDKHKQTLLKKEEEKERRHIEETIQRLHAIEKQRRLAHERKLDRERRRVAYTEMLGHRVLMLQSCERGRQGRKAASYRHRGFTTLAKWMVADFMRTAMFRVIRNRTIVQVITKVETVVDKCITKACYDIRHMVKIQRFKKLRSARIIQDRMRDQAKLHQRSAGVIGRATRCWLFKANLRRACIRRSILRYRGSLSRRSRGLPEPKPQALKASGAMLSTREDPALEGCWWYTGPAIVPRPRWGNLRVKEEEARSRQRAASLAHLIGAERVEAIGGAAGVPTGEPTARWHGDSLNPDSGRLAMGGKRIVGFGGGDTLGRRASMLDPRQAEAAALKHKMRMEHARRKGPVTLTEFKQKTVAEKHLLRQRQFEAQREKRKLAVERELQRKGREKVQKAAEEAQQRAFNLELSRRKEEEREQLRLAKLQEFREKKAAKDLADRKVAAANRNQEQRDREQAEAEWLVAEAAFEEEKMRRLERVRRKRRSEEEARNTEEAVHGRREELTNTESLWTHNRIKKAAAVGRRRVLLAPIAPGNPKYDGDMKRRREGRLRRTGASVTSAIVWRSKAAARARNGRLKLPHGTRVPALPAAPGQRAIGNGNIHGDRKRVRRRSPSVRKGVDVVGGAPTQVLMSRNRGRDLERLSPMPAGGKGLMSGGGGGINSISTDSTWADVMLDRPCAEVTTMQGSVRYLYQFEMADMEASTEGDEGRSHRGTFADDEQLTLETLDWVFRVPGSVTESGGDDGLGATSPPDGVSLGRRSDGSRGSDDSETLRSFVDDSKGKMLTSCGFSAAGTGLKAGSLLSCVRENTSREESQLGTDSTHLLKAGRWISSGDSTEKGGGTKSSELVGDKTGVQATMFGAGFSTRPRLPAAHRRSGRFEYASRPGSSPRSSLGQIEYEEDEHEGEKRIVINHLVAALLPLPLTPVARIDGNITSGKATPLVLDNAVSPRGVPRCISPPAVKEAKRIAVTVEVASFRGGSTAAAEVGQRAGGLRLLVATATVEEAVAAATQAVVVLLVASSGRDPTSAMEVPQRVGDARCVAETVEVVAATQAGAELLVASLREGFAAAAEVAQLAVDARLLVATAMVEEAVAVATQAVVVFLVASSGRGSTSAAEAAQRVSDTRCISTTAEVAAATQAGAGLLMASLEGDFAAATKVAQRAGDARLIAATTTFEGAVATQAAVISLGASSGGGSTSAVEAAQRVGDARCVSAT